MLLALSALAAAVAPFEDVAEDNHEVAYWLAALRRQSEDLRSDLAFLAPWLDVQASPSGAQQAQPSLDKIPSLLELAHGRSSASR